jgi:hypothetical protein
MLAALHPGRVRQPHPLCARQSYNRSSDSMVRIYSTTWGGFLAWMLAYLPTTIQQIALGEMYGGSDRVVDSCLR